jgi:hypothetical protein
MIGERAHRLINAEVLSHWLTKIVGKPCWKADTSDTKYDVAATIINDFCHQLMHRLKTRICDPATRLAGLIENRVNVQGHPRLPKNLTMTIKKASTRSH